MEGLLLSDVIISVICCYCNNDWPLKQARALVVNMCVAIREQPNISVSSIDAYNYPILSNQVVEMHDLT